MEEAIGDRIFRYIEEDVTQDWCLLFFFVSSLRYNNKRYEAKFLFKQF